MLFQGPLHMSLVNQAGSFSKILPRHSFHHKFFYMSSWEAKLAWLLWSCFFATEILSTEQNLNFPIWAHQPWWPGQNVFDKIASVSHHSQIGGIFAFMWFHLRSLRITFTSQESYNGCKRYIVMFHHFGCVFWISSWSIRLKFPIWTGLKWILDMLEEKVMEQNCWSLDLCPYHSNYRAVFFLKFWTERKKLQALQITNKNYMSPCYACSRLLTLLWTLLWTLLLHCFSKFIQKIVTVFQRLLKVFKGHLQGLSLGLGHCKLIACEDDFACFVWLWRNDFPIKEFSLKCFVHLWEPVTLLLKTLGKPGAGERGKGEGQWEFWLTLSMGGVWL